MIFFVDGTTRVLFLLVFNVFNVLFIRKSRLGLHAHGLVISSYTSIIIFRVKGHINIVCFVF